MNVHTVTLTIPDIEAETPKQAAWLFLASLITADWSGGLMFEVNGKTVVLEADDIQIALENKP